MDFGLVYSRVSRISLACHSLFRKKIHPVLPAHQNLLSLSKSTRHHLAIHKATTAPTELFQYNWGVVSLALRNDCLITYIKNIIDIGIMEYTFSFLFLLFIIKLELHLFSVESPGESVLKSC